MGSLSVYLEIRSFSATHQIEGVCQVGVVNNEVEVIIVESCCVVEVGPVLLHEELIAIAIAGR